MAIEPSNINVLPTGTEITLDEPSGNGIRLSRLSVVGNPYRLLDGGQVNQDITEWSFDPLATAADPVSVAVTYSCTLTISAAAKAQFDAQEILFTPTSAAWHPDQDDGDDNFFIPDFIFDASVAESISENSGDLATWSRVSGDGTVQSGGLTLGPATTHTIQTTPTYDGINKVINLPSVGDGNAGPLEFSSGAQNVRSLALVISMGSSSGASPIAPSTSSDFAQWTPNGSGKLTDIFNGQYFDVETAWDGEIKGTSGSEVVEFEPAVSGDLWYRNEQAGSQSRPAIDQVFVAILREPGNYIPWQFIGARWNSLWQRTGPMKVHCVMGWPDYINDDYALLLQQWLCWKAFNEGWTPTLLLPDTGEGDLGLKHPYRDSPAGGAGVPSVTIAAPQPTITITVIDSALSPVSGAAVHLDTSDFLTNLIDGETDSNGEITASYSGSIPQNVAGWARSGSGPIAYSQADIAGTINGDFAQTVILRED